MLYDYERREIYNKVINGAKITHVANDYRVSRNTVRKIVGQKLAEGTFKELDKDIYNKQSNIWKLDREISDKKRKLRKYDRNRDYDPEQITNEERDLSDEIDIMEEEHADLERQFKKMNCDIIPIGKKFMNKKEQEKRLDMFVWRCTGKERQKTIKEAQKELGKHKTAKYIERRYEKIMEEEKREKEMKK